MMDSQSWQPGYLKMTQCVYIDVFVLIIIIFFNPGEYTLAAELYREVLRSSEEHKEKLKTDSLQVSEHYDIERHG